MTTLNRWKMGGLLFALYAWIVGAAVGQTYQTLATFDGTNGATPNSTPLVQGADGNFYGTAFHGGLGDGGYGGCPDSSGFGCGTAFRITPQGSLTVVYNFPCNQANCTDGVNPTGNLILGIDGNFYGTTSRGGINNSCVYGCGTFFRITPAGKLTTLHSFCALGSTCPD